MKVLLLGSGGREHALAWRLAQNARLKKLYAAPGSAAIHSLRADSSVECAALDIQNPAAVVKFCRKAAVDLIVVGPEAPLEAGVADALTRDGLLVFGPGKAAARLEWSKAFAKGFMARHKIPTARWEAFTDSQKARAAAEAWRLPVVVKADGLAAGKGVSVCTNTNDALGAVTEYMEKKVLGEAGNTVVLEDCLEGPEASIMAFCDGRTIRLLPISQDHKRLKDNDKGPNTGGMGAFAPAALDTKTLKAVRSQIFDRVLAGLKAEGLEYRGLLYAGIMLTPSGPRVLEFNCRFGDPETQAVLPLLRSDLLEYVLACATGRLSELPELDIRPGACVCVTLASQGYPGKSAIGKPISGLENLRSSNDQFVFHSGTTHQNGKWLTHGGRVLSVAALGADIASAREKAYAAVARIRFDGMQFRNDIAGKAWAAA